MIALARMAANLADARVKKPGKYSAHIGWDDGSKPVPRTLTLGYGASAYPASTEYYRIIDRITRGEKP